MKCFEINYLYYKNMNGWSMGKKTCTLIWHNELIIKETVRSVRNNLDFFHEKNSKGFDLYIINSTQIAFNQCGRFNFNILVKSFKILYWKCPWMWTRFWFYEKKCSKDNKHWRNMLILNLFSNLWDQQAWPHK